MSNLSSLAERYEKTTSAFLIFTIAYAMISFVRPVDHTTTTKYHLTSSRAHEIVLAVILPYIIIWVIAFAGYLRLRAYSDGLGDSPDGKAFRTISTGVMWFTFWLPLSNLSTAVSSAIYTAHPSLTATMIQIVTYVNVLLLLPAFIWVARGSKGLLDLVRVRHRPPTTALVLIFLIFTILYTTLVLHDPFRQISSVAGTKATYYLSDWVLVTTVLIPRLLSWFLGVVAVQNIMLYRRRVNGVIYKAALQDLGWGLGAVVLGIVVLRTIQSLTSSLNRLNLGTILLIIYVLLIILAIGYVYIARGARKLQRIEDL